MMEKNELKVSRPKTEFWGKDGVRFGAQFLNGIEKFQYLGSVVQES